MIVLTRSIPLSSACLSHPSFHFIFSPTIWGFGEENELSRPDRFNQWATSVERRRTKDERSCEIRGNVVCQGERHKRLLKPMKLLSKHFSMCGKVAVGQHLEVFISCAACDWEMFSSDDFWSISCHVQRVRVRLWEGFSGRHGTRARSETCGRRLKRHVLED